MKNNLLICDCETGDVDEQKSPITQITMEVIDPIHFETIHYFETFVQPYNNLIITPEALKRSRVTMQQINAGVPAKVLVKNLIEVFKIANKSGKGATMPYFVGHNFEFDMKFLVYLFRYMQKNLFDFVHGTFYDTLFLMKLIEGNSLKSTESQKYTLTACCDRMGIELRNAHGAAADVQATKLLFAKQINRMRNVNSTNATSNTSNSNTHASHRTKPFFEF